MSEFSTELRSLLPEQFKTTELFLANSQATDELGYNHGQFNQDGTFNLAFRRKSNNDKKDYEILFARKMWSPSLLPYDPDRYQIRSVRSSKAVMVKSRNRDTVSEYIPAKEIRFVNEEFHLLPKWCMVGRSGYLLFQAQVGLLGERKFITTSLLDEILLDAQKGIRPKDEFLRHIPLIQTDPKYAGQTVEGIFFDNNLTISKIKEVPDAAVLTEDGHLLGRKVRYPLSPQNWDLRSSLGLVKNPVAISSTEPVST